MKPEETAKVEGVLDDRGLYSTRCPFCIEPCHQPRRGYVEAVGCEHLQYAFEYEGKVFFEFRTYWSFPL